MMGELRCTRCDKKLSRKTARTIDGKTPLCSTCLFSHAQVLEATIGRNALTALASGIEASGGNEVPSRSDESPVPKGDAPAL